MVTPLIILALLLVPALIGYLAQTRFEVPSGFRRGGVAGLAIAFGFFASGHFIMPGPMADMLPSWVPAREAIVIGTGLLEIGIALLLIIPRLRMAGGWLAAAVLVGFFPANIYAALNAVGPGGHQWGPEYLWIRAPLQIFVLGWVYWFVLRTGRSGGALRPAVVSSSPRTQTRS